MDIGSKGSYPSNALSNFACHPFYFCGILCNSMEGFLQSLKFSNPDMQVEICKLVGYGAKKAGKKKNWQERQILYWQGVEYKRDSKEYQNLLDRAYDALAQNPAFCKALLATRDANLTHEMGRTNKRETVLTRSEFCRRLMNIRTRLQSGEIFGEAA